MPASLRPLEFPGAGAPAARAERIERSHLRCAALGLARVERPDFMPMVRDDLALARERNRRLFAHAAPVMEMLFEQVVDSGSMIVLTDAQGTILHSLGDDDFLARAGKVALAPGVNWAEQAKGTNAIGTALVEELPTLVHGGEHFIHANSFLTCSAAPIFDARGHMLGVLDVSGDQRSYHPHTMGLVRMSARMIENHWLSDDDGHRLRLHFHQRPEFIGTLMEGILVVGGDGRVLGANRSALDQLGLAGAALRMHTLASLFGTSVAALVDHFRAPLAPPLRLAAANGRQFHAGARFNGPVRSVFNGFDFADDGPTADAALADRMPAPREEAPVATRGAAAGLRHLDTGDAQVAAVLRKVERVLGKDIPLLILGETGTGKELLARAAHQDSGRARQPFVAVNCAAIPESLIEAELFGHEEGAFTGARRKGAAGRIVQADGGTLFLDEIGDMPPVLQARLLRVLQERSVTPLGGHKAIEVDIAIVSATHRNLREMIAAGSFREDLYYRLNGLAVRLPALRDRSDLRTLATRILAAECPQAPPAIAPAVMAAFERHDWPGNIRQLANVLRTAAAMAAGETTIVEAHLSDDLLEDLARPAAGAPQSLRDTELDLIRAAVDAAGGNVSQASRRLGISRNTIYRKIGN